MIRSLSDVARRSASTHPYRLADLADALGAGDMRALTRRVRRCSAEWLAGRAVRRSGGPGWCRGRTRCAVRGRCRRRRWRRGGGGGEVVVEGGKEHVLAAFEPGDGGGLADAELPGDHAAETVPDARAARVVRASQASRATPGSRLWAVSGQARRAGGHPRWRATAVRYRHDSALRP
jgi:hypothetical protein